ncbi:hypothetical protein QOT17_008127 [Balamuthia mandrillaris]
MHSHSLPLAFHRPLQPPPLHRSQTSFCYEYPKASIGIEPCTLKVPVYLYDKNYTLDLDYPLNVMATRPTSRRNNHPSAAAPSPIPAVPARQVTGATFPSACGGASFVLPQAPIYHRHHQQQQNNHVAVEDNSGYTQHSNKYNCSSQDASPHQQVLQAHSAREFRNRDASFDPALSPPTFGGYYYPVQRDSQVFTNHTTFLEHRTGVEDDNAVLSAVNQRLHTDLHERSELIFDKFIPGQTKRKHTDPLSTSNSEEPPQRRRRLSAQRSTSASSMASHRKGEGDGREDEEKMVLEEELAVFPLHPIGSGLVFAGHRATCQEPPQVKLSSGAKIGTTGGIKYNPSRMSSDKRGRKKRQQCEPPTHPLCGCTKSPGNFAHLNGIYCFLWYVGRFRLPVRIPERKRWRCCFPCKRSVDRMWDPNPSLPGEEFCSGSRSIFEDWPLQGSEECPHSGGQTDGFCSDPGCGCCSGKCGGWCLDPSCCPSPQQSYGRRDSSLNPSSDWDASACPDTSGQEEEEVVPAPPPCSHASPPSTPATHDVQTSSAPKEEAKGDDVDAEDGEVGTKRKRSPALQQFALGRDYYGHVQKMAKSIQAQHPPSYATTDRGLAVGRGLVFQEAIYRRKLQQKQEPAPKQPLLHST